MLPKFNVEDSEIPNQHDLSVELVCGDTFFRLENPTKSVLSFLGMSYSELVGCALEELFASADAQRIRVAALNFASNFGAHRLLSYITFSALGNIPLDLELVEHHLADRLVLKFHKTAATTRFVDRLFASIFEPTSDDSPSMLYISDVRAKRVRVIQDNLVAKLGLSRSFSHKEFIAISHPEDIKDVDEYLQKRLTLADGEFITFEQRVRTIDDEWRTIAARSRVLSRGEDGAPTRMLGVIFDVTEFNDVHRALLNSQLSLTLVEKDERERLGRDLHDTLSQTLVGASLLVHAIERTPQLPTSSFGQLRNIRAILADALEQVRSFSFLLHPPELSELGLAGALERSCRGLAKRFELDIAFRADPTVPRLGDAAEFALFRVAQESLLNIHRHARADRVTVCLNRMRAGIQLSIHDNGVGLSAGFGELNEGVGIAGMRARMRQLGGSFLIENASSGVCVVAEIC